MFYRKNVLRSIFGIEQRESCKNIFKDNNILTLFCIIILDALLFVVDNRNLCEDSSDRHSYMTRNRRDLISDRYNFSYLQRNVEYTVKKIYNSFPENVRNLPGNRLKQVVRAFFGRNAFYSLDEFYSCDKSSIIA